MARSDGTSHVLLLGIIHNQNQQQRHMGNPLKKDVRVVFAASSSRSLQNLFQFSPRKKIGIFMIKSFTTWSSPSEMADCTNRRMHIIVCRSSQLCWRLVRTTRRRLNSKSKLKANKVEAQLQSSTMMFCWIQSGWFISASSYMAAERWSTK